MYGNPIYVAILIYTAIHQYLQASIGSTTDGRNLINWYLV